MLTHLLALIYMGLVKLEVLPVSCYDPHAHTVCPLFPFTFVSCLLLHAFNVSIIYVSLAN